MEKAVFWKKVSGYALVVMLLILIIKKFFKEYYNVTGMYITSIIGILAVIAMIVSEIMQYKFKKK